jgi:hypothetical protein
VRLGVVLRYTVIAKVLGIAKSVKTQMPCTYPDVRLSTIACFKQNPGANR